MPSVSLEYSDKGEAKLTCSLNNPIFSSNLILSFGYNPEILITEDTHFLFIE